MKNAIVRYWLQKLAMWLADNNKAAVTNIQRAIVSADQKIAKGPEKLETVRKVAVQFLSGKAGWIVDTVIHLLLAYTRKS